MYNPAPGLISDGLRMDTRLLSYHPSNMHAQMEKTAAICLIEGGTEVEGEGIILRMQLHAFIDTI